MIFSVDLPLSVRVPSLGLEGFSTICTSQSGSLLLCENEFLSLFCDLDMDGNFCGKRIFTILFAKTTATTSRCTFIICTYDWRHHPPWQLELPLFCRRCWELLVYLSKTLTKFCSQVLLVVGVSLYLWNDLPFCLYIQTHIFVMFNKVITAQVLLMSLLK